MDADKYTYQVSWSEEDQEYVATVWEFPALSWLAPAPQEAVHRLVELVAGVLADMADSREQIPAPLG
ncbi:antitoxin HicB [Corynebacterium sp. A21]|uniref:antitoxin HicB n=1 Tax=Corynebacterium sp. A21 TaxID=3457318 RepID=UPI003FD05798